MPLMDHFHPPLSNRRHWEGFHASWASLLAERLNDNLPKLFYAEPQVHVGGPAQVDVATLKEEPSESAQPDGNVATLPARVWTAPPATWTMPGVFPESFEVQVINSEAGPTLVAAIELISPGNKDRPDARRAFAAKCASYLSQGIHLIILDIVTSRSANLHNELMGIMDAAAEFTLPETASLYAVAYRPVRRHKKDQIDVWPATLTLENALPTLPLYILPDLAVPIDFEATYQETARRLRLLP